MTKGQTVSEKFTQCDLIVGVWPTGCNNDLYWRNYRNAGIERERERERERETGMLVLTFNINIITRRLNMRCQAVFIEQTQPSMEWTKLKVNC